MMDPKGTDAVELDGAVLAEAAAVLQEHLPKWRLKDFIEVAIQNQIEIVKLCGGGRGLDGRNLRPNARVTFPDGQIWPSTPAQPVFSEPGGRPRLTLV